MDIWIDADTGTYGVADDLYLLHVNDAANVSDLLDSMTDNDRAELAIAFGEKVVK